jgi:hypothetical protein
MKGAKRMKVSGILFFTGAFLLLMVHVSHSAPAISSVSGTATNGQTITIYGAGFGVKSPAKPVLWADFEGGNINPNSTLGLTSSWYRTDGWVYSAGVGWGGSGGIKVDPSLHSAANGTSDLAFRLSGWYFNALSQKSFWFRRVKRDYTTANLGGSGLKTWEAMPYPDQYTNVNNVVMNAGSGQWITQQISPDAYYYYDSGTTWTRNWISEEAVIQVGASAGASAKLKTLVNGAIVGNALGNGDPHICLRGSGDLNIDQIDIAFHGAYSSSGDYQSYPDFYDHLYVDNTWARVYIGDHSTWGENTTWHKEIQIPTAWSDQSVAVAFNQGTFQAGQTVYLYVVDANDQANAAGYPLTVGQGGSTGTPPATPVGLVVR